MAEVILIKHSLASNMPFRRMYFYDGETIVRFGVIELPVDKEHWMQRAFMLGFRYDPETGRLLELDEIKKMARAIKESAESAGDDVEGTDTGGLPAGEDGLRESELPSDEGIPESGVDSGVSDGATVRAPRRRAK